MEELDKYYNLSYTKLPRNNKPGIDVHLVDRGDSLNTFPMLFSVS
jgi:hypothetical protein